MVDTPGTPMLTCQVVALVFIKVRNSSQCVVWSQRPSQSLTHACHSFDHQGLLDGQVVVLPTTAFPNGMKGHVPRSTNPVSRANCDLSPSLIVRDVWMVSNCVTIGVGGASGAALGRSPRLRFPQTLPPRDRSPSHLCFFRKKCLTHRFDPSHWFPRLETDMFVFIAELNATNPKFLRGSHFKVIDRCWATSIKSFVSRLYLFVKAYNSVSTSPT